MGTYILTSMFSNGFGTQISERLQQLITKRSSFVFVASEFEKNHEKTDRYFHHFLKMFEDKGIHFASSLAVDSRLSPQEAQNAVAHADVVWLAGGDSPAQFEYLKQYGLDKIIQNHSGIVIGMSAGAINLAKIAVCTVSSGHEKQSIYEGLGCVTISAEPHFTADHISDEIWELSDQYLLYGLCDASMIVCNKDSTEFYGNVYKLFKKKLYRVAL